MLRLVDDEAAEAVLTTAVVATLRPWKALLVVVVVGEKAPTDPTRSTIDKRAVRIDFIIVNSAFFSFSPFF